MLRWIWHSGVVWVILVCVGIPAAVQAERPNPVSEEEAAALIVMLKSMVRDVDSPDGIRKAAGNQRSWAARKFALGVLVYRDDPQKLEFLLAALDDPELHVRVAAAHWLGTLDNAAGLARMQRDYSDLVDADPEAARDESWKDLQLALLLGDELAQQGDDRAVPFAEYVITAAELEAGHSAAAGLLAKAAAIPSAERRPRELNPIEILERAIERSRRSAISEEVYYQIFQPGYPADIRARLARALQARRLLPPWSMRRLEAIAERESGTGTTELD